MVRALYIHPPKTAGTSIRRALESATGKRLFGNYSARDFDPQGAADIVSFSHTTPQGLLHFGRVTRNDLRCWHVFATIRNPWARLVSGYFSGVQSRRPAVRDAYLKHGKTFAEFAEWVLTDRNIPSPDRGGMKEHQWTHPQVCWYQVNGEVIVNQFIRVEHAASDWERVCAFLGVHGRFGCSSASKHEPYRTYYSPRLRDLAAGVYADDIALGGYSF
jgi:hypothetical protein